jgi:hypothetical protein
LENKQLMRPIAILCIVTLCLAGCHSNYVTEAEYDSDDITYIKHTNIRVTVVSFDAKKQQYRVIYEDKCGVYHSEWLYYGNIAREPSA